MPLFWAPPPPVSYSAEVAPIFAMHCNGCHGDAGGLSTRTYAALMAGGNAGAVIRPGNAEGSLLVHFIDGRRGERQRMPKGGRALSTTEIAVIRRWIDEGAHTGADSSERETRTAVIDGLKPGREFEVIAVVKANCYAVVSLSDPVSGRVLWSEEGPVKSPREPGDSGSPGEPISWKLRAGKNWPPRATAKLVISYAAGTAAPQLLVKY